MTKVENQGVSIHFTDCGSGPPVVLGHSFLCSGEMWAPQLDRLSEHFRVINIDARGHGQSGEANDPFTLYDMVADVLAVLDHLGIERAAWAGLSIGGMVALRAALTAPERVSALVLLDTHAGSETRYKKIKYTAMALGVRVVGVRPFLPAVLPLFFGASTRRTRPALVAEWRSRFGSAHVPSMLQTLQTLIRRDSVVARLREIEIPSLVIVGAEDSSLPPACSRQIAAGLLNSSLMEIEDAGHLANLEQPEEVTSAMIEFLEATRSEIAGAEEVSSAGRPDDRE